MKGCDCEEWEKFYRGIEERATGWEWCPYCGSELEEEEKPMENIFCDSCGTLVHYDQSKCPWCGIQLKDETYGPGPLASAGLTLMELSKRVNNKGMTDIVDTLSKKNPYLDFPNWKENIRDDMIDSMRIPSELLNYDQNGVADWKRPPDETDVFLVEWGDEPVNKNWRRIQ